MVSLYRVPSIDIDSCNQIFPRLCDEGIVEDLYRELVELSVARHPTQYELLFHPHPEISLQAIELLNRYPLGDYEFDEYRISMSPVLETLLFQIDYIAPDNGTRIAVR